MLHHRVSTVISVADTPVVLIFARGYVLELTATVLLECDAVDLSTADSIAIVFNMYYYLAYWALLVVVVYTLNIMLREHLDTASAITKRTLLTIINAMFAVTAAQIAMTSYNLWVARHHGTPSVIGLPAEHLRTAWTVLYLASVLAAGTIAIRSIFAMRSSQQPEQVLHPKHSHRPILLLNQEQTLLPWVLALFFSLTIWSIIGVVFAASYLDDNVNIITFATNAAFMYVMAFFQALSFILLLRIASHRAWAKRTPVPIVSSNLGAQMKQGQYIYAHPTGER